MREKRFSETSHAYADQNTAIIGDEIIIGTHNITFTGGDTTATFT